MGTKCILSRHWKTVQSFAWFSEATSSGNMQKNEQLRMKLLHWSWELRGVFARNALLLCRRATQHRPIWIVPRCKTFPCNLSRGHWPFSQHNNYLYCSYYIIYFRCNSTNNYRRVPGTIFSRDDGNCMETKNAKCYWNSEAQILKHKHTIKHRV